MAISENDTLFTLIGTTYGGDGVETFALPDLQCRFPMHQGTQAGITYTLAEKAGTESETLTIQQIPQHTHPLIGSSAAASATSPAGNVGARVTVPAVFPYGVDDPPQPLSSQAVAPTGGSQPHENMQPFLCISFIISLFGVYPSAT